MSDDELLKMLVETPPEEWSAEQIEALQQRLSSSPELQAALGEHLWLDQTLHQALGRTQISAEQIFARAQAEERSVGSRRALLATVLAALLVAGGGLVYWLRMDRAEQREVVIVDPPRIPPKPVDVPESPLPATGKPTTPDTVSPPTSPPEVNKQSPVEKSVPIVAAANEPWSAALAAPPVPFEQAAFTLPKLDDETADPQLLTRWFQPLKGQLQPFKDRKLSGLGLEGLAQLRAPLPDGAALRVVFYTRQFVRFHFWSGTSGASFEYTFRGGDSWAAYQASRTTTTQSTPQQLALCGPESDCLRRVGNSIVDFRYQSGQLVLSCGDVLIATVPLAAAPQNIVIETEKRCVFSSLQLIHTTPFPLPPIVEAPALVEKRPRDVPWIKTSTESAEIKENSDGSVTLAASDLAKAATIKCPVQNVGWSLLDVELENVTPGAGVFVIDEKGTGVLGVGVYQERNRRMPFVHISSPSEKNTESTHDPGRGPFPALGTRQWLRLIPRPYGVRVLASIDGRQWSECIPIRGYASKLAEQIGIYVGPGKGKRAVTLHRLRETPLVEVPALCPLPWRERMPNISQITSISDWYQAVLAAQPVESDARPWRWACAATALKQGVPPAVVNPIIEVLIEAARSADRDQASALRLLQELSWLSDPNDYRSQVLLQLAYEERAMNNWRTGDKQPLSSLRLPLTTIHASSTAPYDPLSTPLTRLELLEQVHSGGWDAIHRLARVMRFYSREVPEPRSNPGRDMS
ncbi:MAG: hypothetical protein JNM18_16280, partial [Planctomycetaceae bacterium]|nr:hypothetical protein [Planctomycetaceae bacterium]